MLRAANEGGGGASRGPILISSDCCGQECIQLYLLHIVEGYLAHPTISALRCRTQVPCEADCLVSLPTVRNGSSARDVAAVLQMDMLVKCRRSRYSKLVGHGPQLRPRRTVCAIPSSFTSGVVGRLTAWLSITASSIVLRRW